VFTQPRHYDDVTSSLRTESANELSHVRIQTADVRVELNVIGLASSAELLNI
jgi:hypothetical protein